MNNNTGAIFDVPLAFARAICFDKYSNCLNLGMKKYSAEARQIAFVKKVNAKACGNTCYARLKYPSKNGLATFRDL